MNNCLIEKFPSCFADLSNLRYLSVANNKLIDLQPFFLKLSNNLKSLNINGNFINCTVVESWGVDVLDQSCFADMQRLLSDYCGECGDSQECCKGRDYCKIESNTCMAKDKDKLTLPKYLRKK